MLYLLDTCAYLRLAKDIDPLLGSQYLPQPDCSCVTSDVDSEWSKNPRLRSKFHWVQEPHYAANRSTHTVQLKGKMPTQVMQIKRSLVSFSSSSGKQLKALNYTIPSPEDCMVLAYVFTLSEHGTTATAVSDDGGLGWVAKKMKIPYVQSEDLVKRMFDAKTISVAQIKSMAGYLDYISDLPPSWRSRGPDLFGIALP